MDPRPYHFDYRRPRLSNPTYQSSHLYDSIYQIPQSQPSSRRQNINNKTNNPQNPQLKRASSTDIYSKKQNQMQSLLSNRYKSRQNLEQQNKISKMANYGNNIMRNISMDQTQIYKKHYFPKEYKPNLRQFPKLTMQDKFIQKNNHALSQINI